MPSRRTPLLRAATVGLTALALALPALAGTSASGATGDRTSSVAPPIPPSPSDARVEKFEGAAAKARPIKQRRLPQHPFLAPNGRSSMHNDAYSSDAYEVSGPLGRDLVVTSATYGIRECATITFDSQDRILALCGGLEGFVMMLIDPVTLDPIAELAMPGRDVTSGANPLTDICGGTYFFLTPDDHAIATTTESSIWEVRETATGLAKVGSWELAPHIPDGDCVVATAPDWKGRVWFFTQQGTVGTLNRRTGKVRTLRLGEARGEGIYNSVSADETGGVYVVTTHAMYRLDAGRTAQPRITWKRDYDRGSVQKPGMLSQGSGTSPTLLGRKWMAITDNADPRTHIVVYDRRKGVKRRLHCRIPVLPEGASTTENSLVAAGNSVIIENNYGYQNPGSTMFGRSTTPGIARVLIKKRGCKVAWTNTSTAPTSVPKGSLGNGLVYAYTKPPRSDGIDAWYLTAIDIRSGKTVWSRLTGTGTQWNNHYAAIYLGPDGTAYIATLSGLVRIQDGPA